MLNYLQHSNWLPSLLVNHVPSKAEHIVWVFAVIPHLKDERRLPVPNHDQTIAFVKVKERESQTQRDRSLQFKGPAPDKQENVRSSFFQ